MPTFSTLEVMDRFLQTKMFHNFSTFLVRLDKSRNILYLVSSLLKNKFKIMKIDVVISVPDKIGLIYLSLKIRLIRLRFSVV